MLKVIIDDQQIAGRTYYTTLPDSNVRRSIGSTSIDVSNMNLLVFENVAPITVSELQGGLDGMEIRILGDGQTSIDNNATIKTSTGALKLLSLLIYSFTHYKGIWYENN